VTAVKAFLATFCCFLALRIVTGVIEPFVSETHMGDPNFNIRIDGLKTVAINKLRINVLHIFGGLCFLNLLIPSLRNWIVLLL
jgi:hypothetical protein